MLSSLPSRTAGADDRRRRGRIRTHPLRSRLGAVEEISADGMRVITKRSGERLVGKRIRTKVRGGAKGPKLTCEVVWARPLAGGRTALGVRFQEVDPASKRMLHLMAEAFRFTSPPRADAVPKLCPRPI